MATQNNIDLAFEVKSIGDEDGVFTGYASVFDVEDNYGDVVVSGAFRRSLSRKRKRPVAMLWQHRSDDPIGVWERMEEDDHGLIAEGRLALKTQRGSEAYELLKMGAINGLSIGFNPIKWEIDKSTGKRKLLDIDLWETSLVTFPANSAAIVGQVRAALNSGMVPNPRDVERVLCDAGFSNTQSRAIVSRGLSSLRLCDAVDCDIDDHARITGLIDRIKSVTEELRDGN